jgi:cobalt transporter subunit CbtA
MGEFRRLMTIVLVAGIAAGLALAAVQIATIGPLIRVAEQYETATAGHDHPATAAPAEWQPSDGFERTGYTVLGTLLVGIAYAALLFGGAALLSFEVDVRRGILLGLAGFASFALAPALGVAPRPPGVAGAELHSAQIWWIATAIATAIGLALIARARGRWSWRIAGPIVLVAPHLVGAPHAEPARTDALRELSSRFAVTSVATQAVFWLVLGVIGGYVYQKTLSISATSRTA